MTRPDWRKGREWLAMGFQDKVANKAQVLKGKVKEAAGKITHDPELEVEGKLDQGKGNIKQAGENVKDAGKSIF
ncbi:MAG: CsbD family protein [Pseudonocardiaceae bacterium]